MSRFNPERILENTPALKKYAEEIHHSEVFNELCTIAVAGFIQHAHPDERQSRAIVAFLSYLTGLGEPQPKKPDPLTIPELIPPSQISGMAAALEKSKSKKK